MSDADVRPPQREKIDFLQIISLILSIYILGSLIIQSVFQLSTETTELLNKIDFLICFFFLFDFFFRFHKAKSKIEFLKWNWIDFVSSIPVYGPLQWARVARIIRILRAVRSTKILLQFLFRTRSQGTLATALLVTLLMMIFSTIAMLNFEKAPESNIKTPEDAIWWAFTTITTVGYGDKYPVTTEGRIVAAALMISSVGLFGIFTGFVASFFVSEDQNKDQIKQMKILIEEVRLLRAQVETLVAPAKPSGKEKSRGELSSLPRPTSALPD